MKKIGILFLISASLICASCGGGETVGQGDAIAVADKAELSLEIEGMVCAVGCAKSIEKKLSEMAGVVNCTVDFDGEKAAITYDRSVVSSELIVEEITEMNNGQYQVTSVKKVSTGKSSEPDSNEEDELEAYDDEARGFGFPELVTYFLRHI